MEVNFDCPACLQAGTADISAATTGLGCRHCGWSRPVPADAIALDVPGQCIVCGCSDLWRQKDFPPGLGLLIVGLAIVLSTVAIAWFRPILALGILMGFALLDMLLFVVMKDRMVCYRCHARYRNTGAIADHGGFKLELNERYRQEAIRLQAAGAEPPQRRQHDHA